MEQLEARDLMAAFTPGDLVVYRVGTGSVALSSAATAVFLDEYSPTGTLVQSIAAPTADSGSTHILTASGMASSEGELNLSPNGQYLALTGYDSTAGTANVASSSAARVVGIVTASGVIDTTTALTNVDLANNIRGAVTSDGTNIWIAGQDATTGGLVYTTKGSTGTSDVNLTGTAVKNARNAEIFSGQLYMISDKTPQIISQVGTGEPVSGTPTLTALPGTPLTAGSNSSTGGVFFAKLGSGADYTVSGTDLGFNTIYVADQDTHSSGSTPGISKYTWNSGTSAWVLNNTVGSTSTDYEGLTGTISGSTVTLYATGAAGIVKIVDSSGYNANINGTATTIVATPTNEGFRGISFAPTSGLPSTTTTVTASPNPANPGVSVTLTATVVPSTGSGETGTVTFFDNGAQIGTPQTLNTGTGQATLPTSSLPVGVDQITAVYSGDSSFAGSTTASPYSETINGPVFSTLNNTEFTDGSVGTFQVTASSQVAISSYSLIGAPAWLSITNAGVLSGTPPAAAQTVSFSFTVKATDANAIQNTQAFTLYAVPAAATPAALTPGDILLYRVGDGGLTYGSQGSGGASGGTAAAVFLDEYTPAGVFVESIPVPTTAGGGNLATVDSISASSDGMLSLSADGHSVVFTGYNAAVGTAAVTSSSSATDPRVVGIVNAAGTVTTNTTTTAYTGNNIRSAATVDGREFYVSGNNVSPSAGVQYLDAPGTASPSAGVTDTPNTNAVEVVDGQLYFSTQSGPGTPAYNSGKGVYAAASPLPTGAPSGSTDTSLIGATPSPDQFIILDMDSSGSLSSGDRLYFVDDTNTNGVGGLYRADYNGSSWSTPLLVASGDIRLEGVTGAVVSSTSATIYATDSQSNFGASTQFNTQLYKLTDSNATPTAGLNWTQLISFSNAGSTAAPVEEFRGVSIVPKAAGSTADSVTVTPSAGPYFVGSPITFTAAVLPSAATGYISFVSSGVTLATVPVSGGQAQFTTSSLQAGPVTITAYYDGDSVYEANSGSTNITLMGGTAPTITSTNAAGVVSGQSGSFQVTATGNPTTFTYGFAAPLPPSWVTINSATGLLSYTAPSGLTGLNPFTFTITVSNGVAPAATQSFTLTVTDTSLIPGDLAVLTTTNSTNATGAIVELQPATPGQTPANTIAIDSTDASALRFSSAGSFGMLNDTSDDTLLSFGGVNTSSSSISDVTSVALRGVGTLNNSGVYTLQTTYTSTVSTGDQVRAATSTNDTNWYIADKNGLYTNGATASSNTTNIRDIKTFGGTVYVGSTAIPISTATTPSSPSTFTPLPGNPTDSSLLDFTLVSSGANGPAFDTLYITDGTVIEKFGLIGSTNGVGGTWQVESTYSFAADGITAVSDGSGGAYLYVTTGTGGTTGNSVVELHDLAAYNAAIAINTANNVTLYTTPSGSIRGIAFAPLAATTLTEMVSSHSVQPGANVTFTANVSSPNAPGGINSGVVYFIDSSTGVVLDAATISGGVATFSTTSLSLGQHKVYAYYPGTTTIADATTATQIVAVTGSTASSVSITNAVANPSTVGATVNFTATVTGSDGGHPTGSVEFFDGSTSLGVATLTGTSTDTATLPVTSLSLGVHSNITAIYDGDATYQTSTSSAFTETINAGATVSPVTSSNGTVAPGSTVTYTATVTGNGLSGLPNGSPTGTVTFYEYSYATGTTTAIETDTLSGSGNVYTATTSPQTVGVGSVLVTAVYNGNTNYASANSANPPWIETGKQAFAIGDLISLDRQNQPSNAAQVVALLEYTPSGTFVQAEALPDASVPATATNIFALSGHAATEGALAESGNESLLTAFGFDLAIGTPSATGSDQSVVPRTVGQVNAAGATNTATAVTVPGDTALGNARGAVTLDGNEYWVVGDAVSSTDSGIRYISSTSAGTVSSNSVAVGPNNVGGYGIELLGNVQGYPNLFVSTQQTATGTSPIALLGTHYNGPLNGANTALPTTQTSLTPLPGLLGAMGYGLVNGYNNNPAPYSFLLFNHLTGTSVNPDTLYIADQNFGLLKFANSTETNGDPTTGTWLLQGQKLNNNTSIEGLVGYEVNIPPAGTVSGSAQDTGYSFQLYATAALNNGNPSNQLLSFTDSAPYNEYTLSGGTQSGISGGLFNVIANAANPTDTFSGLSFAPLNTTTAAVVAAPNPSIFGQAITLTATVIDTTGAVSPTGLVTFYVDGLPVGTATLSTNAGTTETATLNYNPGTPLAIGTHTITASYGGDANDGTSQSASYTQTVKGTTTTTIASHTPNPSTFGQNVAFTVNVTPTTITGNGEIVTLEDASNSFAVLGTGTLTNGSVVINVTSLSVGTHSIVAVYGGDALYQGSTSAAVTQTVTSSSTAVTLSYVDINSDANDTAIYDGGTQRSMVNTVVYHFDHAVNLSNSAIQITLHSGVTVTLGNGQQSSGTVGIVPSPVDNSGNGTTWSTPDGGFTWVITFGGAGVTGGGSIADGVYDIKLLAAAVTTATGGAVVLTPSNNDGSGNDTETFWCLYGDSNQDQKVTAQDYSQFSSTYLARSNNNAYIAWFDQQGDDKVTAQDYSAFANNYLKKYSGFSATI